MAELTVSVWMLDPAFSQVGVGNLAMPQDWVSNTVPGGSPEGNDAYVNGGTPVPLHAYVKDVTLMDRDGDGFIGKGDVDAVRIDGVVYSVWEVYRGDFTVVDGTSHQMVTLYVYDEAGAGLSVSIPTDSSGKLIQAYPGKLSQTTWSMDAAPYPIPMIDVPCFTQGTRIATPHGPVPVETLRPGDLVLTAEGASVPVIWIAARLCRFDEAPRPEAVRPILVPMGTLGAVRDLWLSPLHRVLCLDLRGREVLVPVRHLQGQGGIGGPAGGWTAPEVRYLHVVLADHSLLMAEGVCCESFFAGTRAFALMPPAEAAALRARLADCGGGPTRPARPLLDRLPLVARHLDRRLPLPDRDRAQWPPMGSAVLAQGQAG